MKMKGFKGIEMGYMMGEKHSQDGRMRWLLSPVSGKVPERWQRGVSLAQPLHL